MQREYNTNRVPYVGYRVKRNDEKFAVERAIRDERNGGKEEKRKRKRKRGVGTAVANRPLPVTVRSGEPTIGIRSRGLMIPMDVFEGPCVGRAGFVL